MEAGIKLGNTLRRLRKDRHLSLLEVSRVSGIQSATLSRIENNKLTGSVRNHFNVSRALGLKLSELFQEFERDAIQGNNDSA